MKTNDAVTQETIEASKIIMDALHIKDIGLGSAYYAMRLLITRMEEYHPMIHELKKLYEEFLQDEAKKNES